MSKNTVKSYQKTIYAKLDVHSKQEIIDLVHGEPDDLAVKQAHPEARLNDSLP
ncbi:MAG: helix-turn-helix transcriptional regulator [Eggerthella lenta]